MEVYDVRYGWTTMPSDAAVFSQQVVWYWGDCERSAVHVQLAEGIAAPVYARVTVWHLGLGTTHYVADPSSLAAFIAKVLPGVQALARDELLTITSS